MTGGNIGYFSTLTHNPQIIQGEARFDYNDPLYIRDLNEAFIPISDQGVYKINKEYDEPSDQLAGTGIVLSGRGLNLEGYGVKKDGIYYAKGSRLSGGKMKKRNKMTMDEPTKHGFHMTDRRDIDKHGFHMTDRRNIIKPIGTHDMEKKGIMDELHGIHNNMRERVPDIKIGSRHREMLMHKLKKEQRKRSMNKRKGLDEKFKITTGRVNKPGEGLKKKLMRKTGDIGVFSKRTKIKDLIKRLRAK